MLKIKKARQKDIADISDLWLEFMAFHIKYDDYFKISTDGQSHFNIFLSEQIRDKKSLVLVGLEDKEICSYLLAKIESRPPVFKETKYGLISDLAVSEKYRRQGIGKQLYKSSIIWFKKHKIQNIELSVATTNPISVAFWDKLGFRSYYERRHIRL